jgi:hypothetical protein
MNGCWDEERIERAAILRAEAEASGETNLPSDLSAFLDHARECFRCGDLFSLFLETERRVLAEAAEAAFSVLAAAPPQPNVVELEEISERSSRRIDRPEREGARYSLAARHAAPVSEGPDRAEGSEVRSFASRDGLYLVRVLPNESGTGRTAVLLAGREGEPHRRALLRFEGGEVPFDESGHAALSETPSGRIHLVLL